MKATMWLSRTKPLSQAAQPYHHDIAAKLVCLAFGGSECAVARAGPVLTLRALRDAIPNGMTVWSVGDVALRRLDIPCQILVCVLLGWQAHAIAL